MCLIAVKDKGKKLPDRKKLENGYDNNSDGVGIAVLKPNKNLVYIKKDFKNFEEFYSWAVFNVDIDDISIIHFRFATSGKTDVGNRHPFPITHNKQLLRKEELYTRYVLAHNGVISDYSKDKGKFSDTQKFIMDIIADLKYKINALSVQKLIKQYINGDRLAIIDATTRNLILIGDFEEKDGILWSNSGYSYNRKSELETYFDTKTKNACELCDSKRKVRWVSEEKALLCKKCRRGIRKKGWDIHYNNLLERWDREDKTKYDDEDTDTAQGQYNEDRKELQDFHKKDTVHDQTVCDMFNKLSQKEKNRVIELCNKGKDFEKAIGQVLVEVKEIWTDETTCYYKEKYGRYAG